jgi:hypothetical protein
MARLAAAAVLLGGEADKWSGWSQSRALDSSSDAESSRGQAGGSLQPEALLRLPDVFSKGYLLPCRVAWVAVPQGPAGGAPLGEEDSSSVVVALRRQQPLLQGLVEEQRFLVHILVEERRLLRRLRDSSERTAAAAVDGGGGGASALARFVLDDAPMKQGTFCPGTRIPIKRTSFVAELLKDSPQPLAFVVFAYLNHRQAERVRVTVCAVLGLVQPPLPTVAIARHLYSGIECSKQAAMSPHALGRILTGVMNKQHQSA